MALPLGKLTIIIGAGLVGSVLAKEGRIPGVFDIFSGANKVLKILKTDDKPTSSSKPVNDSLLQQVNSLRQELQLLASNRPLTIVTSNNSGGANKYSIIIIVAVTGYGYLWWKGWKLPDMMFATKRSLADATNAVAKQLETVYSSLATTKRHLSSRIDRVNCSLDEFAEITAATQDEVHELHTTVKALDVQAVHARVSTLESKLNRIELKQDDTNIGVARLLRTALTLENQASMDRIQGDPSSSSSRPALEAPQRAMSLPAVQIEEIQPSPAVSPSARRPLETAASAASGLRVLNENPDVTETSNTPRTSATGLNITEDAASSSRVFGRTFSGFSSVFMRGRPPTGERQKGKSKVAWEVVCLPKKEGGGRDLHLRALFRDLYWYRIGDGATCSLWFDRWCPSSPLASIVSTRDIHRAGLDMFSKVKDVIHNGDWLWPLELSSKYPILSSLNVPSISTSTDALEWQNDCGVSQPFSVATV
ncbi:mediator of RNA polymerase II transcription subunit 1 like protein [Tanacetum coccineum]